jgi:cytochrome c peroxidase
MSETFRVSDALLKSKNRKIAVTSYSSMHYSSDIFLNRTLLGEYVKKLADGEIFYIITHGIKISGMPGYRLKTSDRERWQLVHYVRHFSMSEEEYAAMTDVTGSKRIVTLRFKPVVGDKAFTCGESYDGIGASASKITPTDFRLYVHNVRLINTAGKDVSVELEQDGKWQTDNIALLDFENGSGPCANGTADTRDFIKGQVPAGNYVGVRFTVGVPFERNHGEPAKAPSPLNLTQMFWVWNSGYKFARIEMKTTGLPQGWMLHLGSTGCLPAGAQQTPPARCSFPNRAEVMVLKFDAARDVILTDLKALLDGANVDVNQEKTARGCMSAQNDADCDALFSNLGLPFNGKQAAGQRFFRGEAGAQTARSAGASPGKTAGGEELAGKATSGFRWNLPAGFPTPKIPEDNQMTMAKVQLGRHLFYDKRLSVNGTQSCASCHDQSRAFTDARARAIGATGEVHPRGSMSIVNIAYTPVLTWANPNMRQLERQALVPMFGEHPVELGLSGKEAEVLAKLKADVRYQAMFPSAFPGQADPFTIVNLTQAMAAFERTLISGDSPYDRYLNGNPRAISQSAKRGEELFFSERLECFHCHGGFNFSQTTDHAGKSFTEIEFHNTGLYNLEGGYPKENSGIFEFTANPEDMGKFRAPSLRNIAVTAPYMHDGSVATLEAVIDHYAAGGRTIRSGEFKGIGKNNPNKSSFVKGFRLTAREKQDLLNFLKSLTDEKFLTDPRFSDPWKPRSTAMKTNRQGNR